MKNKEKRPSFNEWAVKMQVSSRWEEDTTEKKLMMDRIRNAKFQQELDKYYEKLRKHQTQ